MLYNWDNTDKLQRRAGSVSTFVSLKALFISLFLLVTVKVIKIIQNCIVDTHKWRNEYSGMAIIIGGFTSRWLAWLESNAGHGFLPSGQQLLSFQEPNK